MRLIVYLFGFWLYTHVLISAGQAIALKDKSFWQCVTTWNSECK
jgi:hypothetical protein